MSAAELYDDPLAWARAQKITLPVEYYGLLQGRARAAAFSVAGLSSLDQLQRVRDSLIAALQGGESFAGWKNRVRSGEVPLDLPNHRLDNIFRTNLQGWYAAGRCRSIADNAAFMPYLEYTAVNDSRTRPSHARIDGTVLPVDHPWWGTHMPPNGFRCRCVAIALTREDAEKRGITQSLPAAQPDAGWDYSPCQDGPEEGIRRATQTRSNKCHGALTQDPADIVAEELAKARPIWCNNAALMAALHEFAASLGNWRDRRRIITDAMGKNAYDRHRIETAGAARDAGLPEEYGVMLRAYTDREHIIQAQGRDIPVYQALNQLAREMVHIDRPLSFSDDELYHIGILTLALDEAIEALPKRPATYWRGVDVAAMPEHLRQQWKDAHRKGRVVQYNGYTSAAIDEGRQYGGDWQIKMHLESARDISEFSAQGEREIVLPRGVQLEYRGFMNGYRTIGEIIGNRQVKKSRNFSEDESEVKAWVGMGYTRERAIEILQEMRDTQKRWERERNQPRTEKQINAMKDLYERMQIEATAGLE